MLGAMLFAGDHVPRQAARGLMWLTLAKDSARADQQAWISKLYDSAFQQATEDELANAAALGDLTGLFNCPHTGVALAVMLTLPFTVVPLPGLLIVAVGGVVSLEVSTSKASTTTSVPDEAAFFVPVTVISRVWAPVDRPFFLKPIDCQLKSAWYKSTFP